MRRDLFYKSLRRRNSGVFGTSLSQTQVRGCEAILDECEKQGAGLRQAAYILATAYGETGSKMKPVEENMNYSAKRLREVWPRRFPNAEIANAFARNPKGLARKVYGGRMGNDQPGDGWLFRGRGIGQITGRNNYTLWSKRLGVPLVVNPDLLMQLDISVRALVQPMLEGWATGRKLSEFVDDEKKDYYNARRVWNGTFAAAKYAGYAEAFEAALRDAGYEPRQTPSKPKPTPEPAEKPKGLLAFIFKLFGGKA